MEKTTDLIVYVPLFTDFTRSRVLVSTVFTRFTVNPTVMGLSPCFSQKHFRAFFSELCDSQLFRRSATFFSIFLIFKGPTFNLFDILQQTGF